MQIKDDGTSARVMESWSPLFDVLCARGEHSREDMAVFEQMTALYTFAAALGVQMNLKGELEGSSSKSIKWQYFNKRDEVPVLAALSWSVSGQRLEVLESARSIITTLEPYVEGGIKYLKNEVLEIHLSPEGDFEIPRGKPHPFNLALLVEIKELASDPPL